MKKMAIIAMVAIAEIGLAHAEPIGYPGSTWGSVTFPAGVIGKEKNNVLLAGRVEQGVDWFKFGNNDQWKFNTYAAMSYSVDNQGLGYNNKITPTIGMKMIRSFDNGIVDLGVQAIHERRWRDDTSGSGVQVYASWWFGWDAKRN